MAGKLGLLVNGVRNFEGSAFVPSKNTRITEHFDEVAHAP
jgi:hypothetical protein